MFLNPPMLSLLTLVAGVVPIVVFLKVTMVVGMVPKEVSKGRLLELLARVVLMFI